MDEGFEVRGEFITLGQLLKVLGIAMTGGEAKLQLEEGEFQVNAEPETRRGRKLRPGDTVTFPDGSTLALAPPANAQGSDEAPSDTHHQQGEQAADKAGQGSHHPTNHQISRRIVRRRRRPG
ncbi:RNA-binding S4 domain-containing protein [Armatimonas sp.]|uniref:RNA-binding S4 domain-containing protein n=1 Tax=Armatimonas sp. TaxID=1872638 RepID=UPI00286B44FC|nr:RNA-binding S4 domain-containing protein [Armatimonas sp.]